MKILKNLLLIFILLFAGNLFSQILIKELPATKFPDNINLFLGESSTRNIINLNGNWSVHQPDKKDKTTNISVPASFKGEEDLVFVKSFSISQEQAENKRLQLVFLGLSYSAEVVLNNYVIYKHPGGEFPFKVDLPDNLLSYQKNNLLEVKINHKLESENTIPSKQRFLFPESFGGIIRDVYIKVLPLVEFSNLDFSTRVSGNSASIKIDTKINNFNKNGNDTIPNANLFNYKVQLISPAGTNSISDEQNQFELGANKEKLFSKNYDIANPVLWNPQSPASYILRLQIFRGNDLIDEVLHNIAFYSLQVNDDELLLNGNPFTLTGTTYFSSFQNFGNMITYKQMEEDLNLIKSMGFNSIRFAKHAPHPYLLELCREKGLLALIELPVNSLPEIISGKDNFLERSRSYLNQYLSNYKDFSAVAAIGLGSSYLSNSGDHANFISNLAGIVKDNYSKLTYASFIGFELLEIKSLDLYGIEIFDKQISDYEIAYDNLKRKFGKGKVFISEATYPAYFGGTNGYLNPYSLEAQAKYFSDLIDFANNNDLSGYFINSAFNYRGDYPSVTAGYTENALYKIGILDENRNPNSLSQKVIFSKLNDAEKVTIPIGSKKDDMPLVFVIAVVVVVMILGVLVNSKRKFREDATRALFRPYNFFADIRDHRMFSFFQANILMIILSLCSSLLLVNLLFFLRTNILFEKILLAFGSESLMRNISYLAWNPNEAIIWLSVISLTIFIFLTIIIKVASLFVKNRVFYSSIYYTFAWAFLPLILLLPLGLMLYKILSADAISLYLLIALVIFNFWIYLRLVKGIYVIFDVNPGPVYFYSLAIIFFIISGVLIYFQFTNSTIYYVINAYKQYMLM